MVEELGELQSLEEWKVGLGVGRCFWILIVDGHFRLALASDTGTDRSKKSNRPCVVVTQNCHHLLNVVRAE